MTLAFSPVVVAFSIAFIVLAVVVAAVSVGVVSNFIVTNRRTRLARHESIRSYYGGFALSH